MIDLLVSRGHCFDDVIDKYPIGLIHYLVSAALKNIRRKVVADSLGTLIAVSDALDRVLNKGQNDIFNKWCVPFETGDSIEGKNEKPQKKLISQRTLNFFQQNLGRK